MPVSREHARSLVPSPALLIDGHWVGESKEPAVDHIDPATGEVVGSWLSAGATEIDAAVAAARGALPEWRAASPSARRAMLLAVADQVERDAPELGALLALEMGQPVRAATAGASFAAEWFRYYAGWADKLEGAVVPAGAGVLDYVVREPYGVVAAIVPWNGPILSLALKLAPALAAGNTIVAKPSELSPFAALRFGQLCIDAGLPPGVVNVVPGGAVAGEAMCAHPGVDKISFTGGTVAARAVARAAAEHQTPMVLELGGKSASLVFRDADPAVAGKLAAVLGVQQNAGQGCFLPTRLFVHRDLYEQVVERVVATVEAMTLGDPFDPSTSMGPVAGERNCARILEVVDEARERGDGVLLTGGARPGGDLAAGSYVEPTVFGEVDGASPLAQEEIFGPVLAIGSFDDDDEAIALANGTRYGLAGYVWTRDLARAHRVAAALDAGYVSVNGMATLAPSAPFGGFRSSGYGTEGGKWGIDEFLRTKNVHVSLS